MPYKLQAAGDGKYHVVTSTTGRRHSHEPLPKGRAEAQLRALHANAPPAAEKSARHGQHCSK